MVTEEQSQFYANEARKRAQAKVLRDFPDIPPHLNLSILLAFDPWFNVDARLLTAAPADDECMTLHRKLALKYISLISLHYKKRVDDVRDYQEMWAKEVWKHLQLLERLHKQVPREVFEDVRIQAEVLDMDPDFSFYKAVFNEEPEPVPDLLEPTKRQS